MVLIFLFVLFLTIYLGPVNIALWRTRPKKNASPVPVLPVEIQPWYIALVFALNILIYAFLRLMVTAYGWAMKEKNLADFKEDVLSLGIFSVELSVVARVQHRLRQEGLAFASLVAFHSVIYTIVFQLAKSVPGMDIAFRAGSKPSLAQVLLCVILFSLLFLGVYNHCLMAASQGAAYLRTYLLTFGLVLVSHIVLFSWPGPAATHVHHYYWGWLLAHICLFQDDLSLTCQALFMGTFIHGIALYGPERVFYDPTQVDS